MTDVSLFRLYALRARTWETVRDCVFGAILIPLIPWPDASGAQSNNFAFANARLIASTSTWI